MKNNFRITRNYYEMVDFREVGCACQLSPFEGATKGRTCESYANVHEISFSEGWRGIRKHVTRKSSRMFVDSKNTMWRLILLNIKAKANLFYDSKARANHLVPIPIVSKSCGRQFGRTSRRKTQANQTYMQMTSP